MIVYLFLVASANLGLGLALAAWLGHRYQAAIGNDPWAEMDLLMGPVGQDTDEPFSASSRSAQTGSETPGYHTASEDLASQVEGFGNLVTDTCDQLRRSEGTGDTEALGDRLGFLLAATQTHLEDRGPTCQRLLGATPDDESWNALRRDLRSAVRFQDAEIELLVRGIAAAEQDRLRESCPSLVMQVSRLASATHHLRDTLTGLRIAAAQDGGGSPAPSMEDNDRLTGLVNRANLERQLRAWWESGAATSRRLEFALLDLDQFTQANARFGYRLGDEILRAVGHLLHQEAGARATVGRWSGQRFAVVSPDADPQQTAALADRLRQVIEATTFCEGEREIRITASCGVAEAMPEDSPTALFDRAENAAREAKRYGGNRTFSLKGGFPSPVVRADSPVASRKVPLSRPANPAASAPSEPLAQQV